MPDPIKDVFPLSDLPTGTIGLIVMVAAHIDISRRLALKGVLPGMRVIVLHNPTDDSPIALICGGIMTLTKPEAKSVMVMRLYADSPSGRKGRHASAEADTVKAKKHRRESQDG